MNLRKILKWASLPLVSVCALSLQSCAVNTMPPRASIGMGATVGNGLIRTTNARWMYDPFRRHYYDMQRRAYFNHLNGRYLQRVPRRYSNQVFPSYWQNRRGTCPAPRLQNRNLGYNNFNMRQDRRQDMRRGSNLQNRVSRQLQRESRQRMQNIGSNVQRYRNNQQYRQASYQGRRASQW